MSTVTINDETLHLTFDDHFRVLSAKSLSENPILNWLTSWLPGRVLSEAYESAAQELLLVHPDWGLAEARVVDTFLKEAMYRTHAKVEVTGSIICNCRKVSKETIRDNIQENMSREELTQLTKAGAGCGSCHPELEQMLSEAKPKSKRWQGEPNSGWVLKLQDSLVRYQQHNQKYPLMTVVGFQEGRVKIKVDGELTADQEWDLIQGLTDFWADGFPAGLSVFLDFSLAQASKN